LNIRNRRIFCDLVQERESRRDDEFDLALQCRKSLLGALTEIIIAGFEGTFEVASLLIRIWSLAQTARVWSVTRTRHGGFPSAPVNELGD
jgi:hypothetical protein